MTQNDEGTNKPRLRFAGAVAGMGSGEALLPSSYYIPSEQVSFAGLTKVDIHTRVLIYRC